MADRLVRIGTNVGWRNNPDLTVERLVRVDSFIGWRTGSHVNLTLTRIGTNVGWQSFGSVPLSWSQSAPVRLLGGTQDVSTQNFTLIHVPPPTTTSVTIPQFVDWSAMFAGGGEAQMTTTYTWNGGTSMTATGRRDFGAQTANMNWSTASRTVTRN